MIPLIGAAAGAIGSWFAGSAIGADIGIAAFNGAALFGTLAATIGGLGGALIPIVIGLF
jgi:hypothetical protein